MYKQKDKLLGIKFNNLSVPEKCKIWSRQAKPHSNERNVHLKDYP